MSKLQKPCNPVQSQYHKLGRRLVTGQSFAAWNKLPSSLRHVSSAATFKRQLQTFLFNHAFN